MIKLSYKQLTIESKINIQTPLIQQSIPSQQVSSPNTQILKISQKAISRYYFLSFAISVNLQMSTLFQQFSQVKSLQKRLQHYHSLHTRSAEENEEQNQFMPTEDIEQEMPQMKDVQICQSQLVESQGDDGLSRIFEDIVLGDEVTNNGQRAFDIVLEIEGQTIPLKLGQGGDRYSLSNFSSFNTCTPKNEPSLDLPELLQAIQLQTSKTLSKPAILSIISQIQQACSSMRAEYSSLFNSETCRVAGRDMADSLFCSLGDTRQTSDRIDLFDNMLNNIAFQRKKKEHDGLVCKTSNRSVVEQPKDGKRQKLGRRGKEDKENRAEKPIRVSNSSKQLKITGKGRELTLLYTDQKHFQQFCILNKIMGKDKDKVTRAIQANKSVLLLE